MIKPPNREAIPVCDQSGLETALTDLATLAAQLCSVPIALICLDDAERIWFKSSIACDVTAIARVIRETLMVRATRAYLVETSLSHADLGWLTAVPIVREGTPIGWLCVLDRAARHLDAKQQQALRLLSHQAAMHWTNGTRQKRVEQGFQQTQQALRETQSLLIQAEKLSSLGEMLAGVAHEINNPVSFVHGNISYVSQYAQNLLELLYLYQQNYPQPVAEIQQRIASIDLDFLIEDLPKSLISMKIGADRLRQIVLSLRNFSRRDEQKKRADIHAGLDSTLMILQHRLKTANCQIEILKEYGQLPPIECYVEQLNQVFMNLLSNAIDAVEQSDRNSTQKIRITTETILHPIPAIAIRIRDNGLGMTAETCDRIFDPFFTTKPIGKGTGLGLAISRKIIVDRHGGQLKCWSEIGQGTEFSIELPLSAKFSVDCVTANRPTTQPAA